MIEKWEKLIKDNQDATDSEKLEETNAFFNGNFRFVEDIDLYGVKDYWAVPDEFIKKMAGDCEDFAIAKYFTLRAMGIPEEKLRLAYTTHIKPSGEAEKHMVLTYLDTPDADPLVLDNTIDEIKPMSERWDIIPIFSFNKTNLWIKKQMAGSSRRIKKWANFLRRKAAFA